MRAVKRRAHWAVTTGARAVGHYAAPQRRTRQPEGAPVSFILADACVITMNAGRDILDTGSVLVEGDRIALIGPRAQLTGAHPEEGDRRHRPNPHSCEGAGRRHGAEEVVHLHDGAGRRGAHGIRCPCGGTARLRRVHPRPGLTQAVFDAYEATGLRGFVCRGFLSDGVQHGVPEKLIEGRRQPPADPGARR